MESKKNFFFKKKKKVKKINIKLHKDMVSTKEWFDREVIKSKSKIKR